MCITKDARIGCATSKIFFHKIVDHKITELFTDIKNEMSKSMLNSSHAGIIETIEVAAAGFLFASAATAIIPCFHGDAYHFIALVIEHESSDSTINTTTHCHQYFSFLAHDFSKNWKLQIYNDKVNACSSLL